MQHTDGIVGVIFSKKELSEAISKVTILNYKYISQNYNQILLLLVLTAYVKVGPLKKQINFCQKSPYQISR